MAMTERSRSTLYRGLSQLLDDDQAVSEMLSYFPARDVEEPVTKEFLRAESAIIRTEMAQLGADLRSEMAALRTDVHTEMADLRTELHAALRVQTQWLVGLMVTLSAVVTSVVALTG